MTSLSCVVAASRPSARTRQTASRPVKIPTSLPVSPVTRTDPAWHSRIRSQAAITLAVSFMMSGRCSRMTSESFRMMIPPGSANRHRHFECLWSLRLDPPQAIVGSRVALNIKWIAVQHFCKANGHWRRLAKFYVRMVHIHERYSASHTINTDFSSAPPASTFAPTFARGRACRNTGVKRHEDRRFLLDDGPGVGPPVRCIRATERRRITWGCQVLQCTGQVVPNPVAAAGGHAGRRRRRLEPGAIPSRSR